jgi:predicted tellurium resistance membrane protein TerC
MSLDNVLAVAGRAKDHPYVLIVGLAISVVLMGVAATFHRQPAEQATAGSPGSAC